MTLCIGEVYTALGTMSLAAVFNPSISAALFGGPLGRKDWPLQTAEGPFFPRSIILIERENWGPNESFFSPPLV